MTEKYICISPGSHHLYNPIVGHVYDVVPRIGTLLYARGPKTHVVSNKLADDVPAIEESFYNECFMRLEDTSEFDRLIYSLDVRSDSAASD